MVEQQRAHATLGRTYYTKLMSERDKDEVTEMRKKAGWYYINALKITDKLTAEKESPEKEIKEVRNH